MRKIFVYIWYTLYLVLTGERDEHGLHVSWTVNHHYNSWSVVINCVDAEEKEEASDPGTKW